VAIEKKVKQVAHKSQATTIIDIIMIENLRDIIIIIVEAITIEIITITIIKEEIIIIITIITDNIIIKIKIKQILDKIAIRNKINQIKIRMTNLHINQNIHIITLIIILTTIIITRVVHITTITTIEIKIHQVQHLILHMVVALRKNTIIFKLQIKIIIQVHIIIEHKNKELFINKFKK
jgi:hypothetical protein